MAVDHTSTFLPMVILRCGGAKVKVSPGLSSCSHWKGFSDVSVKENFFKPIDMFVAISAIFGGQKMRASMKQLRYYARAVTGAGERVGLLSALLWVMMRGVVLSEQIRHARCGRMALVPVWESLAKRALALFGAGGHGRREAASELRRHSRIAAHLLHRALTSARVSPGAHLVANALPSPPRAPASPIARISSARQSPWPQRGRANPRSSARPSMTTS